MSQLKAYLVDFDGTLVDTSTANYLAYSAALDEVGIRLDRQAFDNLAFGKNWRQFLPGLMEQYGSGHSPAAVAARKAELYRDTAGQVSFNEALVYLLENRAPTIKAALVTSASAENVRAVFAGRPGVRDFFDVVVTGDDVSRHKPDPQAYIMAATALEVGPENCLVFEDSDAGMLAGKAFGAPVLRIIL